MKHKQLTITERKELAESAVDIGINQTAIKYGIEYNTIKHWHDRLLNNEPFNNIKTVPLTSTEHKLLDSYSHLVGHKPIHKIKSEYSLPFSIRTIAHYYNRQNIIIARKHLLVMKCPECKACIRVINVFFGRPRNIQCPCCGYYKLGRHENLLLPFYNQRHQDYFLDRSILREVNSINFNLTVLPMLKISDNLKCLFLYNIQPRKLNRIHIVKYFENIGNNTIPITYCNDRFPNINKREILNPRSKQIDTNLLCQNCQLPYLKDFIKYGDRFPKVINQSIDQLQIAIELFLLAKKYNLKTARALMGVSKKKYYDLKKRYIQQFDAVNHLFSNDLF